MTTLPMARREVLRQCKQDLLDSGFFHRDGCYYRIDVENRFAIVLGSSLLRGNTISMFFSPVPLFSEFRFDTKRDRAAMSGYSLSDFEKAFADDFPDYKKAVYPIQKIYIHENGAFARRAGVFIEEGGGHKEVCSPSPSSLPLEEQCVFMVNYIKNLALPVFNRIHTLRDLYEFRLIMEKKIRGDRFITCLSAYLPIILGDWDVALACMEHAAEHQDIWLDSQRRSYAEERMCNDEFQRCVDSVEKKKRKYAEEIEHILAKDSTFFEERFEKNFRNTVESMREQFPIEIRKGILKLPDF